MVKVITYGTYDLFHYGHQRLLERAKALGDYLIVGVTSDSFDLTRGKINAQQSLMERIEAVKATGLADEIIVEEYEGQKIDDIKRYGIDIFTVGSDWKGKFDYLNEFCEVVYLDRTEGVSSSEIRSEKRELRIGIIGNSSLINKFEKESQFVNGVSISGICTTDDSDISDEIKKRYLITGDYDNLLELSDAIYVVSHPRNHFHHVKQALQAGKHVLCESPVALSKNEYDELLQLAKEKNLQLMDAIKTAYSTAYNRMLVLAKAGKIGDIVSVDSICTSLSDLEIKTKRGTHLEDVWNSICAWGPTSMLPIFQLLGSKYTSKQITSHLIAEHFDIFTKIAFVYPHAVASLKVGKGVKSEGELIISGTKGYIYVPAPWWKTDYFEIRYENPAENRRYFYQLDGEGIRYELVSFLKAINTNQSYSYISTECSSTIVSVIEDFILNKLIEI